MKLTNFLVARTYPSTAEPGQVLSGGFQPDEFVGSQAVSGFGGFKVADETSGALPAADPEPHECKSRWC